MQPSLEDGDRLLVDRLAYSYAEVSRFDVVVLRYPNDTTVDFVKRIVGLPGDSVRINKGAVFVNGNEVAQGFDCVRDSCRMSERVIPDDHYFVLGDNRPISCDSREFGFVAHSLLKGKVRARFWPPQRVDVF